MTSPRPLADVLPFARRPIRNFRDAIPYWRAVCVCGVTEPIAGDAPPRLRCCCGHAPTLMACFGAPHIPASPKIR